MKNIPLIAVVAISVFIACSSVSADRKSKLIGDYSLTTVEFQGCEYVLMQSNFYNRGTLTHKGNCRYCRERRMKGGKYDD